MTSLNNIAKIAGAGYLVIFISGIFANFFVLEGLVVAGDAAATATRIMDNGSQLRVGILSFFIMVIFDLLLVWALYLLFRPVNKDVSLLAALLRLVNVAIFGVALYHLVDVMQLSGDAEYLSAFNPAQLNAQLMLAVDAFNATWLIGLVFFGLHLIFLGCLIIKSSYVPSIIGMLLIVAAAGYLIDSFAHLLLPSYDNYATIFMLIVVVPGVIGELSLTILLLVKGFRHKMPAA